MSNSKKLDPRLRIIFLTVFIDLVGFTMIFPLFPAILKWYLPQEEAGGLLDSLIKGIVAISPGTHAGDWQVMVLFGGILGALYSLVQFASSPLWGSLSDCFGRRKILIITITGTLVGYLFWGFSGSFLILLLSRLINGLMAGNLSVATAAIADITDTKNRSRGMALIGIAFGLGFILGPALGGMLSHINLVKLFPNLASIGINPFSSVAFFAATLSLINIIWVRTKFKETHPAQNRTAKFIWKTANPLRHFHGNISKKIQKLALVYFTFTLSFSGMEFTLTFLAGEHFHYTSAQNVYIFLYIGFILLIVQGFIIRKYASIIGEWQLAVTGVFCSTVGLLFLSLLHTLFFFYVGLTFLGIGMGLANATLLALMSLYSNKQEQGTNIALLRSCGSLARAFGPIFAAILYWQLGSTISYSIGATLMSFSLILLFSSKSLKQKHEENVISC